jgi:hypothetical protein
MRRSGRAFSFPLRVVAPGIPMTTEWLPVARNSLALMVTFGASAASGVVNAPPVWRRAAAFGLAALLLAMPFVAAPTAPGVRFLCAASAALAFLRNLDIVRDSRPWSTTARAFHLLFPFDTRRVVRSPRRFEASVWVHAAAFGLATGLAVAILVRNGAATTPSAWLTRWFFAAIAAYCSIEVVVAAHRACAGLLGFTLPKLHDHPILARSLAEFWGKRWNLSVRDMLHEHCFRPLSRRAPLAVAVFATFMASAFLHAWLLLAAGGYVLALSIASFFVIQGALVLVEQRARIRRWPVMFQRAWTVLAILLPLPLLLEPLLALVLP